MVVMKLARMLCHQYMQKLWLFSLAFLALILWVLPLLPSHHLFLLFEYSIYFSPRWLLLFLLVPIIIYWASCTKFHWVLYCLCVFTFIRFQDLQWHIPTIASATSNITSFKPIKLLSLNMGGGSHLTSFKLLVEQQKPDIVLLQESRKEYLTQTVPAHWHQECVGGLCIASKYAFKRKGVFNRKVIAGWGNFAAYYELDIAGQTLPLMNLHLETPRSIIMGLLSRYINWSDIDVFHEKKILQTTLIKAWADAEPYFVMAGDFNMTVNERLFQHQFSSYQNALSKVGVGVVYTKYTSWHGIRIDHVLASTQILIHQAEVLSGIGGDHRSTVTQLSLPK